MRRLFAVIPLLLFVLASCKPQKVSQSRSEKLYKKENNELNARFCVYHLNDSVSQLFYDISNEALIYKKTDTSHFFYSICKIYYKTSAEPNYKPLADSGSTMLYDRQMVVDAHNLKGSLYMRVRKGGAYFSEVTVTDYNKHSQYVFPIYIDKSSKNTRQNFLIRNAKHEVHFNSYFTPGAQISLETEANPELQFTVDYFFNDFGIARPPFVSGESEHFHYKPDSSFTVARNNGVIELTLPPRGFYHLKTDDVTKEGVSCFVYEPSYPKISNTTQMVLATRYIMSKKEFDICMSAEDKKTAIDHFWLDVAGSNERARELIRRYYNRVQESNKLFTSHREGWKTDRGMIYIVFGAPTSVIRRKNGEVWTYGDSNNPNSVVCSFIKVENPFSDNDFLLERNDMLKAPWYQAVDFWRQGRIYLDN